MDTLFDKLISDGWKHCGYCDGCPVFRRIENGRGKWCAIVEGNVQPITYEQGLGYEPITSSGRLARFLGAKLLP